MHLCKWYNWNKNLISVTWTRVFRFEGLKQSRFQEKSMFGIQSRCHVSFLNHGFEIPWHLFWKLNPKDTLRLVCEKMRFQILISSDLVSSKAARAHIKYTWKLSNSRWGMLSSNCCIAFHGPSPTPTKIIERGCLLFIKLTSVNTVIENTNIKKYYIHH